MQMQRKVASLMSLSAVMVHVSASVCAVTDSMTVLMAQTKSTVVTNDR